MNDRVEERLGSTLERRAESVTEGPRFSAEEVVSAGRTAARRRTTRMRISVAATVGLTVLTVVAAPALTDTVRRRGEPAPAVSKSHPPPRSLPTRCRVERLPVPRHSVMDMVIDMDPTGRYVVGRTNPGGKVGRLDMLIWDNGHLQVVKVPGDQQLPTDINASGVVVGTSGTSGQRAWIYRDGVVTDLPGERPTVARAINDAGVVVGKELWRPVVWRSPSDQPTALPMPSGAWEGGASDIAADGTIVGTLTRRGTSLPQAYAWLPDGTLRHLPAPVIAGTRAVASKAMSIADGWVGGTAQGPHGDVPTLWSLRTGEVRTFPEMNFGGGSVSPDGWLVGNQQQGRALLASAQGTLVLPDLDNHRTSMANLAVAISQDGRLVAGGGSAGGELQVPVVWRCR